MIADRGIHRVAPVVRVRKKRPIRKCLPGALRTQRDVCKSSSLGTSRSGVRKRGLMKHHQQSPNAKNETAPSGNAFEHRCSLLSQQPHFFTVLPERWFTGGPACVM